MIADSGSLDAVMAPADNCFHAVRHRDQCAVAPQKSFSELTHSRTAIQRVHDVLSLVHRALLIPITNALVP
jgi:hypothetical protein